MLDQLSASLSTWMPGPSRRLDGLNGMESITAEEVESARREQIVINIGALSNKELKPLIEWLSS
jgi:hypothetical protein